ncbi:hypothetical protein KRX51_01530 [Corynebacterium sp. TAE3-ERU12]|uniref:DUF6286 domain-containing protein n=1 Tax=Corynebacterium sp. TAE3-ERU12 TaxID=2849491 RepID=UPI001C4767D5|nr:DUF6286 domain-containing protein [Corynebacterium sp. TAE3-ERU12]MBV7294597.1 hypothetical protein [Corynebacterium sp. TAE3-ERU12]
MKELKPPKALPASLFFSLLFMVLLIGAAVVAIHDLLVRYDVAGRPEWFEWFLNEVLSQDYRWLIYTILVVFIILGVFSVLAALKPRRKTHLQTNAAHTWIRPMDVARRCSLRARSVAGVFTATTVAKPNSVKVSVHYAGNDLAGAKQEIEQVVTDEVTTILAKPPKVRVHIASKTEVAR